MGEKIKTNIFTYRSSPIFRENDKETIKAWESRQFDTMFIFCKLYRNEVGKQGIGYVIMYEDGWQYGSFHAHLSNLDIKEASLRGLHELLSHASELKPRRIIIWTENKRFLEQLSEDNIKRKKKLAELMSAFEQVNISLVDSQKIEKLDQLKESAFSSAKSGAQTRRKSRLRAIVSVSFKEESKEAAKRREEEIVSIMAEGYLKYINRPIDEKIKDAENELKEIETNIDEQPDYYEKREKLLDEIKELNKQKGEIEQQKKKIEEKDKKKEEARKLKASKSVNQILLENNICFKCGKTIEKEWKFCPFCSTSLTEKEQEEKQNDKN